MREALLLVFLIITSILIFVFIKRAQLTDGFVDVGELHSNYITRQLSEWGNVGVSLITTKKMGILGDSADKMLQTVGEKGRYPLLNSKDGLWKVIDKCEAIKTTDCNAFDNPEFRKDCGICLDIGENSDRVPATGGLVLLEYDKKIAKEDAYSNFLPDYQPTVGFCPTGAMVSNKEECLRVQRQRLCNKNSSYDLPGCSQCYSDTSYSIVDPNTSPGVISDYGTISVVGEGMLKIEEARILKENIRLNKKIPYNYTVRGSEGSRVKLSITPPYNSDDDDPVLPYISGILSGETATGTFTQDLRRIVLVDEFTGRKPRSRGKTTINETPASTMAPGHGKDTAVIVVIIPFSFSETTTMESTLCKDSPFVTRQASAEFLESDPCYKKGSGPGKFSLECLQGIWNDNSCTAEGRGYPGDAAAAAKLMTGSDGTFLSLNDISDFIYNKALITSTSIDENGVKYKIKEWSEVSVFCTGREITSPCDTDTKNTGPLTPDCIVHLWNNQSSKKTWQGKDDPIGPTYYNSNSVSLFKEGPTLRSCTTNGTLSPIGIDGVNKKQVIRYWQKQGGVNNVKRIMADLHRAANAQVVADDQLAPYFKQCYGDVDFAPRPPTIFVCKNSAGLPTSFTPTKGTVIKDNLEMSQDYKLDFDITPIGTTGNWGSIIHFSHNSSDGAGFGSRTPAIWFFPGGMGLHVRIGDSTDLNWGFDNQPGCAMGKTSHVSLECKGNMVRLKIDGNVYLKRQPTYRFGGTVKVYGCDPWYDAANARVDNLCLQLLGNSTGPWKVFVGNSDTNEKVVPLPSGIPNSARNIKMLPSGFSDEYVFRVEGNNMIVRRVDNFGGWGAQVTAEISNGVMPHIPNVEFVRIEGGGLVLNLSQLVVLDEYGNNISRGRPQQVNSETYGDANKTKANDGGEAPRAHPNEYHGAQNDGRDLWQVHLQGLKKVSSVIVYNRSDCCTDRMASGYVIKLFAPDGSGAWKVVFTSNKLTAALVQVVRTRP